MGLNWKNGIACSICGLAVCGHVAHEAHQNTDYVARPLADEPALDAVIYVRLPHDGEPEAPSGPLRLPGAGVTANVTSSASVAPSLILGMPRVWDGPRTDLVWNPDTKNIAWFGATNQTSGSNVSPASTLSTIYPGGSTRSS